jgi:hypothetical protein
MWAISIVPAGLAYVIGRRNDLAIGQKYDSNNGVPPKRALKFNRAERTCPMGYTVACILATQNLVYRPIFEMSPEV